MIIIITAIWMLSLVTLQNFTVISIIYVNLHTNLYQTVKGT